MEESKFMKLMIETKNLRNLITNIERQNNYLKNKTHKTYEKIASLLKSKVDKFTVDELEEKDRELFDKLDLKFQELSELHSSNLEVIKILENKLQELLVEDEEKEFDFGPGDEITRWTEEDKQVLKSNEPSKFGVAVTYFTLCLVPIAVILIIANLIKDFLS
ncbi:hypothetical protein [Achromobacter ruhlandii]|uniref:hypothetical protein n=1 Tax=Achromobacter ruhlandii TaxID=72557 RepID=UPI003BA0D2CF